MNDLVVLTPDADIEQTVRGLLSRTESLGICRCEYEVKRHPGHDPGCRTSAAELLHSLRNNFRFALVIFDRDGCGSSEPREAIQQSVEASLRKNGWECRSKVIVIQPEVEAWLWNGSPHVAEALGWRSDYLGVRRLLQKKGLWPAGVTKPPDPKQAMRVAMDNAPVAGSRMWGANRFRRLAKLTTLTGCTDPAFVELVQTLRSWFPADA